MTRRYGLSDEAANDLLEIYKQGVERFGEVQADTYHDELHYALNLLGDFPEAARERFELKPPLRVHPKGVHLIYRIERPGIYVVRVLHQRQDWMNLLSQSLS